MHVFSGHSVKIEGLASATTVHNVMPVSASSGHPLGPKNRLHTKGEFFFFFFFFWGGGGGAPPPYLARETSLVCRVHDEETVYTGRKRKFNCALLVSEMYCKCELSCSCQQLRKDGILFSISGYTTHNDRAKFPVLNSSPLSHLKHHV